MTDYLKSVKQFNEAFNVIISPKPTLTPLDNDADNENLKNLKLRLIQEEFDEVKEAFANNDLANLAKEISDLQYVVSGLAIAYGIDLDGVFDEVHRSNMSKLGEDGKPIYRADGKVLKGTRYTEANIAPIIAKQIKGE